MRNINLYYFKSANEQLLTGKIKNIVFSNDK